MNKSIPPAIIKLRIMIPKMVSICVPATSNTTSNTPEVIMAVFETAFLSSLPIFYVRAINKGTGPIGSITTKRAIVDFSVS